MSRPNHGASAKAKLNDLLIRLLDGQRPTPTRIRKLMQELEARRDTDHQEEPPMAPQDDPNSRIIDDFDDDVPMLQPAADDPPELQDHRPRHQPGGPPVREAQERSAGLDYRAGPGLPLVPDAEADQTEQAEIAQATAAFGQWDRTRRERILRKPLGALRRSRIDSLREAADVLLAQLQPNQSDRVREIAEENGWESWVVVLGAIARAADLQELAAGEMDPEWLNNPGKVDASVRAQPKCVRCGHEIPNARKGQVACCSLHGSDKDLHSEGCTLSAIMKIHDGTWVDTRRIAVVK